MKKITWIVMGIVYFQYVSYASFNRSALKVPHASYVTNEILVKFKPNTVNALMADTFKDLKVKHMIPVGESGWIHIKLDPTQSVEDAISKYQKNQYVQSIQPNYIYKIKAVPNDPYYSQMWALKNTGQTIKDDDRFADQIDPMSNPGTINKDIDIERAWNLITDCSSVIIAVVDTGINYNHSDLNENMWDGGAEFPHHGYDFVNGTNNPMDFDGHGTHVSGTIAAVGNNGIGTTGICWRAKLMAVRVLDATGSGTTAAISQGIDFAVKHGAKVINLSLGSPQFDPLFEEAIINAKKHGVILSVAAGNESADNDNPQTPTYPCNSQQPNVICVAALNQNFSLVDFSNYGKKHVAVAAPGVNILSTWSGDAETIRDYFHDSQGQLSWIESHQTGTGWNYGQKNLMFNFEPVRLDMLLNPLGWGDNGVTYANNADDHVYKTFDTHGADAVILDFKTWFDLDRGKDFLNVNYSKNGEDPFLNQGINLDRFSGSTGREYADFSYDISTCNGFDCTIGFQLLSGSSHDAEKGIGIFDFKIHTLKIEDGHYNIIEGTSMATPHVTGLVAMVMAYNPKYTYLDVVNAVIYGGTSIAELADKTISGKAINALGSLRFVQPPTMINIAVR